MGTVILADVTELTTVKISELLEFPTVDNEDRFPGLDSSAMVTKSATREKLIALATTNQGISGGKITYAAGTRHINLTGEGDAEDALTLIEGGTIGEIVTLWRVAGIGYNIVITANSNLKLQLNKSFILNSDYDNITLVSKGSDVWAETGGRISPG